MIDAATSVRTRRRTGTKVRGHLIPADSVTVVDVGGLPVASVVDTWRQLCTTLTLDELIIMGDALVCRQRPPATMAELEDAVGRQAGRPGARLLREAFRHVRPCTDSPRETVLRLIILRAGLPEPEVNGEILGRFGEFLAWGDLLYRRYKVLTEYDGEGHREDEKQFHRDVDRLDALMEENWRVIRYNKSHLGPRKNEIEGRIRRALIERGWHPPS